MSNFTYIKACMLLIRNSITIPENLPLVKNPPESQFECTVSFIGDLEKWLEINITECLKNSQEWNIVLCTKLQRELMSCIGLLSETKTGYEELICQNRFLELLHGSLHRQECAHLVYLILINLDFYRDDINKVIIKNHNGSTSMKYYSANAQVPNITHGTLVSCTKIGVRYLLETCIKDGSTPLKLACVEIIKILLIAEVYSFTVFSYQLILRILQAEPDKSEIVKVAIELLEENLTNNSNVEIFLRVLADVIIDFDTSPHVVPQIEKTSSEESNHKDNILESTPEKAKKQESE